MNDSTAVGNRLQHLDAGNEFDTFTRVIIHAGEISNDDGSVDELVYTAGNTTGRTLEVTDPNGTQEKANAMLAILTGSGFQYQPGKLQTAQLDPAAEIGDGVSAGSDFYSGIFKRDTTFSPLMTSDVEAPSDEEIEHEFPYIPKSERTYRRDVLFTRSQISLNADSISAEVSRATAAEGTKLNHTRTNTTFGWKLTSAGFYLNASGGKNVFTCTKDGIIIQGNATVTGKIQATSGYIGSSASKGFTITSYGISNGTLNEDGTDLALVDGAYVDGVFIARNKIRLGDGFVVNRTGEVSAKNLKIYGGAIDIKDANGVSAFHVSRTGTVTATNLRLNGGSINIKDSGGASSFTVSSTGNVTCNSITIKNDGSTVYSRGNFSGGLSGCGGSVSSSLSFGSGVGYSTLGGLKTKVDTIEATYITADAITADLIRSKFGSSEMFSCGGLRIGGRLVSTTSIVPGSTYSNILYLGGYY